MVLPQYEIAHPHEIETIILMLNTLVQARVTDLGARLEMVHTDHKFVIEIGIGIQETDLALICGSMIAGTTEETIEEEMT